MTEHDNLKLDQSMHYCRGNLKKGCDHKGDYCKCKPLTIIDWEDKSNTNNDNFVLDLWEKVDGELKPVRIQCIFGNTKGKAKASGARAMLEILR